MRRNLIIALIAATVMFVVNDIAPNPMGCSPDGCMVDVARRWAAHSLGRHLASFLLPFVGLFVTFQWIAPWTGRVRARARARMWGHPPPQ